MKMTRRVRVAGWTVLGIMLVATAARAEQVEIVTYYPSPSATTDDLRAKRVTVGNDYKALNLDDPLATIPDGALLVGQSVGIGLPATSPVPFTTAPDTHLPPNGKSGNLDVNDVWLRGAQAWASEIGGGGPPPKPVTIGVALTQYEPNTGSSSTNYPTVGATYNAYAELQLWRYGVAPNAVRVAGCRAYWAANPPGSGGSPGADRPQCTAANGVIYVVVAAPLSEVAEVDVTW